MRRRIALLFGALLVFAAGIGIGYPLWWTHRSNSAGAALLANALESGSYQHKVASCSASLRASTAPSSVGVLEIPSIGLVAPVLQGLGDNVIDVAVGHDQGTPWPGNIGESIVEAHDVSYFANLSRVRPGAQVIWLTSCAKVTFTVNASAVRQPGDLVYPPASGSGLALITCYPTNALFWTNQRFVVTTSLQNAVLSSEVLPRVTSAKAASLNVPAPPSLVAQGLALNQNALALGVLSIGGSPSASWSQGPGPLVVEADALSVFFGAKKAVAAGNHSWWSAITVPGLGMPASWPGFGTTNVSITVSGSSPSSITFSSGSARATVVVRHGTAYLASVS